MLRDPEHALVKLGHVQITPEVAVFDRDRRLVYDGRIDDWYIDSGRRARQHRRRMNWRMRFVRQRRGSDGEERSQGSGMLHFGSGMSIPVRSVGRGFCCSGAALSAMVARSCCSARAAIHCTNCRCQNSVTFNRDIAPIIFHSCSTCHRPGEAAPFSLLTYSDVKKHARQIADVTRSRVMPPWLPEPQELKFADEMRLVRCGNQPDRSAGSSRAK